MADGLTLRGVRMNSGGVRGVWIRNRLKTRHERLLWLEKTVRERDFELTEEYNQALERFDPECRERHKDVKATGELVAVDTFFSGNAEGDGEGLYPGRAGLLKPPRVGPVLHPDDTALGGPVFLNNDVLPTFEELRREGRDGAE
ncbi:hypothetical protein [Candidatus Palauibacter sp.]|uniref:hypothetical protein n=1 Tax=Candidatus Palauibacter sp. TaxID=3101350 RepID=UPI003AF26920